VGIFHSEENQVVCQGCCVVKKSRAEYQKEYNQKNREKILAQKKARRMALPDKGNTQKKRDQQRKYDEINKEKIKAKRTAMILCECGEKIQYQNHKHLKSKTHLLKVEMKNMAKIIAEKA
jgi:hypothetical protein